MKKKLKISPKAFKLSLLFGLVCSVFLSFADFNSACDDLRENVLRLHIIANSDSDYDQELKLEVRDAVLNMSNQLFKETDNIQKAIVNAKASIPEIKETAQKVIYEKGYNYEVEVKIKDTYFDTRVYDTFTLPAGVYPSLVITVGEGMGKNWWCVIFPEICIPSATNSRLSDSVTEQSAHIAENSNKYIIKFKFVEIYEKIKKSLL